jgi:hypothetical protein
MEVGSPEWIEASLARLDELERERDEHEAALESAHDPLTLAEHNNAIERLDAEIKSLYAQLEAVADDDDEDEEQAAGDEGEAEDAPRVTVGDEELSSPYVSAPSVAEPAESPIESPLAAAAEQPLGGAPVGFDTPPPVAFDDDLAPKGGSGKWVLLGLVIVGGLGVGSFFAWQNMQAQKQAQPQADAEPEKVIRAAEIREDTEAPNTAPSGQATISPNANPTTKSSDSGGSGKKVVEPKKKKPLKINSADDPLG